MNFKNLAAVKVIPALLTPGINARIWNKPINIIDLIFIFEDYEFDADAALRSKSKSKVLSISKLDYYKKNFVNLARS